MRRRLRAQGYWCMGILCVGCFDEPNAHPAPDAGLDSGGTSGQNGVSGGAEGGGAGAISGGVGGEAASVAGGGGALGGAAGTGESVAGAPAGGGGASGGAAEWGESVAGAPVGGGGVSGGAAGAVASAAGAAPGGAGPTADAGAGRGGGGSGGTGGDVPEEAPVACSAERCNGVDDDCDGIVDEDVPGGCECVPGLSPDLPCGETNVGQCEWGIQSCDAATYHYGDCVGSVGPAPSEGCDGLDNDCNDLVDDGIPSRSCVAGLGVCAAGEERCQDGQWECTGQVSAGEEVCDGLDNDCDGIVDYELVGGVPVSVCDLPCVPEAFTLDQRLLRLPSEEDLAHDALGAEEDLGCTGPGGSATLSYSFDCESDSGWMTCVFGVEQDLTAFDVGYGGAGALAVEFCLEGTAMSGALNLWYGQEPNRRFAVLKPEGEPLAPGCYLRLIAPEDVCTPGYENAACPIRACGTESAACQVPGLDSAEIVLAAEWACTAPSRGSVTLRSVEFYPPECLCLPGAICADADRACSRGAGEGLPLAACSEGERCAGLCLREAECEESDAPEACTAGLGACESEGVVRCIDGQRSCDAVVGAPSTEICDGVDNDCDGAADEAPLPGAGEACDWEEAGCRLSGWAECREGGLTCIPDARRVPHERCNGVDDDCDGEVDEGLGLGTECVALGICGSGELECGPDEGLRCSSAPGASASPATEEVCNGVDDDCDGAVDEDVAVGCECVPGVSPDLPCGMSNVGQCRMGTQACSASTNRYGDCVGAVYPDLVETCDGVDNDCNGEVDDVPEGEPEACTAGLGACERDGVVRCIDGRRSCDAVAGAPSTEICDGVDNDCDGVADEAPLPGVGEACDWEEAGCSLSGWAECRGGGLTCIPDAVRVPHERCNGVDDDCDGEVDEGLGLGTACVALGICGSGELECGPDEALRCSSAPGASASPATEEVCNGVDDDCDGAVDEDVAAGCECVPGVSPDLPCGMSNVGQCRMGTQACSASTNRYGDCVGAVCPDLVEACDGVDNDCNGEVDDVPEGEPEACTAGLGACESEGVVRCVDGRRSCDAVAGAPSAEICDGVDNDCDGLVDYAIENGVPRYSCICQWDPSELLDEPHGYPEGDPNSSCVPNADGSVTLSARQDCQGSTGPWASCLIGSGQDYSAFDANAGNRGIMEVSYCVEGTLNAEAAFWYGVHPMRKKVIVASAGAAAHCGVGYFLPSEACFDEIDRLDPVCWFQCGTVSNPACVFDYTSSDLLMTVAGCSLGTVTDVEVTLYSVNLLEDGCRCLDSTSCAANAERRECVSAGGAYRVCVEEG